MNLSLNLINKLKVNKKIIFLLTFFLIAFPKGGFKVSSIPFTWGYLLLAFFSLIFLIKKKYGILREHILVLISFLPFQLISLLTLLFNGFEKNSFSFGFLIAFIVSFYCLPFCFFFIFSKNIVNLDLKYFFTLFKRFIFFISCYGVFLFFYKILTGKFLELIFFTINAQDKGFIDIKHINRGAIFKLISTYNNGNLYGICLIMMLPLYNLIEKKTYKKFIVKSSLIFTLSRTVWIGLIISEFFFDFFIKKNKKKSFIKFFISFFIFITALISIGFACNFSIDWFFDLSFGGRIDQFDILKNIEIFSTNIFWTIKEIVYLSILENFSILGFIAFLIAMLSPLIIYLMKNKKTKKINIDLAVFFGLLTYLIISCSDGAILYIPIMSLYLFLSSLLLTDKKFNLDI
ncbi:MAG: hypothetical protein K1060chlam5_00719 [Candidatus Anoxychlamydiales bacterium]|nr:hypothetical protein [Candidatus Anoxychlamydiales bacterium]